MLRSASGSCNSPRRRWTGEIVVFVLNNDQQVLSFSLQLGLHSDRATFTKHSRFSREQEILLDEEISYNSAW